MACQDGNSNGVRVVFSGPPQPTGEKELKIADSLEECGVFFAVSAGHAEKLPNDADAIPDNNNIQTPKDDTDNATEPVKRTTISNLHPMRLPPQPFLLAACLASITTYGMCFFTGLAYAKSSLSWVRGFCGFLSPLGWNGLGGSQLNSGPMYFRSGGWSVKKLFMLSIVNRILHFSAFQIPYVGLFPSIMLAETSMCGIIGILRKKEGAHIWEIIYPVFWTVCLQTSIIMDMVVVFLYSVLQNIPNTTVRVLSATGLSIVIPIVEIVGIAVVKTFFKKLTDRSEPTLRHVQLALWGILGISEAFKFGGLLLGVWQNPESFSWIFSLVTSFVISTMARTGWLQHIMMIAAKAMHATTLMNILKTSVFTKAIREAKFMMSYPKYAGLVAVCATRWSLQQIFPAEFQGHWYIHQNVFLLLLGALIESGLQDAAVLGLNKYGYSPPVESAVESMDCHVGYCLQFVLDITTSVITLTMMMVISLPVLCGFATEPTPDANGGIFWPPGWNL